MSLPVLLRALGDSWKAGELKNVCAQGGLILTHNPLPLNADAECVLRLPPKLTKANQPLMIRFLGTIVRCDHLHEANYAFRIALQSRGYSYLPNEEAAKFGAMLDSSLVGEEDKQVEEYPNPPS